MGFARIYHSGVILFMGLILCPSCRKDYREGPPVIHMTIEPESGSTTQRFVFDLTGSKSRTGRSDKLFARWDWEGDGQWDTPYTRLLVYEYRYLVPGTWHPLAEVMDLEGATDTASLTVEVARGASPPRARLKVMPGAGHILTDYILDATSTSDDEDSLWKLKFRWDFEGDGNWDTPFGDSSRMTRRYPEEGFYRPSVWVRDPSGLSSQSVATLRVTREDPLIAADFTWSPDPLISQTETLFDASSSADRGDPGKPLRYRWDWENDGNFDTEWMDEPLATTVFRYEMLYSVRLQVMNQRGLMNDTTKTIWAHHKNQPPRAHFRVSTTGGNTKTLFRFDSWTCRDQESMPSELLGRWDFESDGTWDTEFTLDRVQNQSFAALGKYRVTLEVMDPGGLTGQYSMDVHVGPGDYETGLLLDKRGTGWEYYGTVKIGDQWWFASNVCVQDTHKYFQYFYDREWWNYYDYGNLYKSGYYLATCPPGWRVPSREDWETLLSNFGEEELIDALMPGGRSGFSLVFGGRGQFTSNSGLVYSGKDLEANYWSTTVPLAQESRSTWYITFDLESRTVIKGWGPTEGVLYSVRCVKE